MPLIIIALSLFLAFMISQRVAGQQVLPGGLFLPPGYCHHFDRRVVQLCLPPDHRHPDLFSTSHPPEVFFKMLRLRGHPGLDWETRARCAWASVGSVVWQAVGFYMILFLAAMEAIPQTFYEAAILDGAARWHQFWNITLPLLWDTMQTALVFVGLAAFDMFAITRVMVVSGSSTGRPADVLATYLYEQAFHASRFGYATAIAVSLFVLVLSLSVFTMRVTRRENRWNIRGRARI